MHENSLESYQKCKADNKFTRLIYKIAQFYDTWQPHSFTDRAVKDLMFKEGDLPFDDMNMVRPKITNLIKAGMLEEWGKVNDKQTKRLVRQVRWKGVTREDLFKPNGQGDRAGGERGSNPIGTGHYSGEIS